MLTHNKEFVLFKKLILHQILATLKHNNNLKLILLLQNDIVYCFPLN